MNNPAKKGEIFIRFEPPDLLIATYVGDIDAPHIRASEVESLPYIDEVPYHLLIIDVARLRSFSPEARRIASHSGGKIKSQIRGVAIVGASFHYRVIGMLVGNAANLLYRRLDNPLAFFRNETEAREWINMRRRIVANS